MKVGASLPTSALIFLRCVIRRYAGALNFAIESMRNTSSRIARAARPVPARPPPAKIDAKCETKRLSGKKGLHLSLIFCASSVLAKEAPSGGSIASVLLVRAPRVGPELF